MDLEKLECSRMFTKISRFVLCEKTRAGLLINYLYLLSCLDQERAI